MIELLFLGSGTSAGVPMIGCDCVVCKSTDPKDHRSRPSVLLTYGGKNVLIDATPELRLQCVRHGINRMGAVVITHGHADHIMGLDDLRRFNTIQGGELEIFANEETQGVLKRCFEYAFMKPDPCCKLYRPNLVQRTIDGPFEINGEVWRPIPLIHGDVTVLGFRVGNMAYCTDTNGVPEESLEMLEGLDLLVIDGLRFTRHTTHFSIEQAIEVSRKVKPKRTYLTHICHDVMHERDSGKLPEGVFLAYDGLRLEVE